MIKLFSGPAAAVARETTRAILSHPGLDLIGMYAYSPDEGRAAMPVSSSAFLPWALTLLRISTKSSDFSPTWSATTRCIPISTSSASCYPPASTS